MKKVNFSYDPAYETEEEVLVAEEKGRTIVLFNDDHNTFDFVIDCLMEVCQHQPEQAEQCTLIVHYKGKCKVKEGTKNDLLPICKELLRRGLTAEIH